MQQIFVFGASTAYGVAGTQGGWADIIKRKLHERMYGKGQGEKIEFYNFGKSGAVIEFVRTNFPTLLAMYQRGDDRIAIVGMGGNNAKAENEPDNFVSTPEEYRAELSELLAAFRQSFKTVMFVGNAWVDESKTMPKHNPLTGGKSYFSNSRYETFKSIQREVCAELDVTFIPIEVSIEEWQSKYLYRDGLHPNDAGYEFIAERVWSVLEPLLD